MGRNNFPFLDSISDVYPTKEKKETPLEIYEYLTCFLK